MLVINGYKVTSLSGMVMSMYRLLSDEVMSIMLYFGNTFSCHISLFQFVLRNVSWKYKPIGDFYPLKPLFHLD